MIKSEFHKFLYLFLLFSIGTTKCYPQKNYFYTSIKVPLGDLILYALSGEAEDNEYSKSDGALFDFGYGVQINDMLVIETGAEAYFFNSLTKRYNQRGNSMFDELDVINRAFAAQVRPVLRLDLNNNLFLRVSTAINYRQLYSSGKFYHNSGNSTLEDVGNMASATSKSNFYLSLQPLIGLDVRLDDSWILGLDLTYIKVDWNNSLDRLKFKPQPNLVIPNHKTSNIFISGRIMFR